MTDELMEARMAELNARNTEKAPAFDSRKKGLLRGRYYGYVGY